MMYPKTFIAKRKGVDMGEGVQFFNGIVIIYWYDQIWPIQEYRDIGELCHTQKVTVWWNNGDITSAEPINTDTAVFNNG